MKGTNVYLTLMKFLESQTEYRVSVSTGVSLPTNVPNLIEYYHIWLLPPKGERTSLSFSDLNKEALERDAQLDRIESWIEIKTGLKPSSKQRFSTGREVSYPELHYVQELPESDILVGYEDSRGEKKTLRLKGKNRLEVIVHPMNPSSG